MLPGLRSDLVARPPASSSAAIRPSKFLLASFGRLTLQLSCSHVPRQSAFLPSLTSFARLSPAPSHLLLPTAPSRSTPVLPRVTCFSSTYTQKKRQQK